MADVDPLLADFARQSPSEFARMLGRGEPDDIAALLEKLPPSSKAAIVSRLTPTRVDAILALGDSTMGEWLNDSPLDDAIRLLGRLPRERCLPLVNSLKNYKRRQKLLQYLHYPAHTLGALVSDALIRFGADVPATEVLQDIRKIGADKERPIVILHKDGRYLGLLDLTKLIAHETPTGPIRDYASIAPALRPETTLSSAQQDPSWHTYNWLPVIDREQRLLGGVSRRALFTAAERQIGSVRRESDLFTGLMTDMVIVLSDLLERILARRNTP